MPDTMPWEDFSAQTNSQAAMPWMDFQQKQQPSAYDQVADIVKSGSSAAARDIAQVPMWLGDTANAATQGVTRLGGEAKEGLANLGIGQHLTEEQAQQLTNPKLPFIGSQDIINAAAPSIQNATGMNINYQPQYKGGEYTSSIVGAVPYAINPEMGLPRAFGMGVGQQGGKDLASLFTGDPRYQQIAGIAGGAGGMMAAKPTMAAARFIADNDIGGNLPSILGDTRSGNIAPRNDALSVSVPEMKQYAETAYKNSAAKGGLMGQQSFDTAVDNAISKGGDQTIKGIAPPGTNHVMEAQDYLKGLKGSPTSLADLDKIDDYLRDKAGQAFSSGLTKQGAAITEMRKTLTDASQNATASDIVNPDAFEDWKKGDQIWSAYRTAKDAQSAIDNAQLADVPSTAIKNYFKNFIKNENNLKNLTPDEINAAKQAAQYGVVTRSLKNIGSRIGATIVGPIVGGAIGSIGGPVGAGFGAVAGEAAAHAVKAPISGMADARQLARGQNFIKTIAERPVVQAAAREARGLNTPSPESPPAPLLALPAPKTTVNVNSQGQAVPITPATRDILGESTNSPSDYRATEKQQAAREKTSSGFSTRDSETQAAKKIQEDKLWQQNNVPPERLVSDAAQRFKDAGLPTGELGNALLRLLNNQQGSISIPQFFALKKAISEFNPNTIRAIFPVSSGLNNNQPQSPQQSIKTEPLSYQTTTKEPVNTSMRDQLMGAFAKAESNGNPSAKNPNSSASGLMQFTDGTWKQMVKRYGDETGIGMMDKGDPKAQQVMAQLYAKDNINRMQPFLQRNPTKGELYQAHMLGADGALRLIKAANETPNKQGIMLFPKAITNGNKSVFFNGNTPRTVLEVYQLLNNKVK